MKHCWKGENAGNQHFLLLAQCFLFYEIEITCFELHRICSLLCFEYGQGEIVFIGKELNFGVRDELGFRKYK